MEIDARSKDVFLATTALEEFWDVGKPIVFLGEWCLLYERRSFWETLNGKLLGSPYDSPGAAEDAYHRVNRVYEKILPSLGAVLNAIHGKNHGDRYWRIVIGPWLQLYLPVIYDRFVHLKRAVDQYPEFTTIGLSEKSFVVPVDTLDFTCFLIEDAYNLQIYTKILRALGREFPCKDMRVPRDPLYGNFRGISRGGRFINTAVNVLAGISAKFTKTVFLRNSYFPAMVELHLAIRNFGRILPGRNQVIPYSQLDYDSKKRDALRAIKIGDSEFERCLSAMLFSDMPQCFVEGFGVVGDVARENCPEKTDAIFSANGWYIDEAFKRWAASSAEKGTMLLGTQHGANYGTLDLIPYEIHETDVMDYYYSWGWERPDTVAKVIPMPANKLVGIKEIGADNGKKGILWAATSSPRHLLQLPFLPIHFQEYLTWQKRFADALPQEVMKEIRFRPHYENYRWGTVERIKDCAPGLQVESWAVPFRTSLENCRLYVCDHLSTTFAEALAANKPTVLFWNPETNRLRPAAQPYFDLLKASGILFDTPEAAALAVAAVYGDVEAWWNAPERHGAIRSFCEQFARTSPNAVALWGDEFARVTES